MDAPIRSINDHIIDGIIEREGSTFTDDPLDRGGATKFGITQRSWDDYQRAYGVATCSVASITEHDARLFYREMYVAPLAWIEDLELRELVIDSAVNCGAPTATKWLQRAAGCIAIDGVIGPETRELVNATKYECEAVELKIHATHNAVVDQREERYIDLVVKHPEQLRFLRGWMRRLRELRR